MQSRIIFYIFLERRLLNSIEITYLIDDPVPKEGVRGSQALILAHFRNAMHGKSKATLRERCAYM